MASAIPPANEERRVKVYELRNHDWYDRGTGFCTGQIIEDEPMIVVKSEDEPIKTLLSTRISKDYEYQRQQETLIVWTDPATSEMALSFQEAEGCASIWEFVNQVQVQQSNTLPDDALSDDALEFATPVMPPIPELSNLPEIEHIIRITSQTAQGRDQLNKFLLGEEYIRKLLPLVEMAEDLESLSDLHRLNNIMKMFILLNDTQIVEYMVSDDVVMGVLAALEYDPEFPDKKATHRAYLKSKSRFKEVVPINNDDVKKKIHVTWRLQYLKDVVLARILDDPTFGVLNSLIFFNQVDIVNHLQSNSAYMKDLFAVVADKGLSPSKRKDAIVFIQQCCLLAKNLQTPARNTLYANFVANGLISVLTYALASPDAGTRHAGLEILVAMIDHDAPAVRAHIHMALKERRISLVDALTNLLHAERDLGAKAQTADAVKVLLDPTNNGPHNPNEPIRQNVIPSNAPGNGIAANGNSHNGGGDGEDGEEVDSVATQTQSFIEAFYSHNAAALFRPLQDLETVDIARTQFNFTESALQQYLIEILIFFVRHHHMRAKSFIGQQGLSAQIAKLLRCSSKHVALTAVKYFRTCLGLQDDFWFHEVTDNGAFGGILDVLLTEATRGRDNLLNSACLEVFDQVRRDDEKVMIRHVVDNYRDRLEEGDRVFGGNGGGLDIFGYLIHRYEQVQEYIRTGGQLIGDQPDGDVAHHIHAQLRGNINGRRWQGLPEQDEEEENYFNTSDDEEGDDVIASSLSHSMPVKRIASHGQVNGATGKSLVPYDDEDSDEEQRQRQVRVERTGPPRSPRDPLLQSFYGTPPDVPEDSDRPSKGDEQLSPSPRRTPESLSEKRKRGLIEDEEEDTLGKMRTSKRRSSSSSAVSIGSLDNSPSANGVSETRQEPSGRGLRSKKSSGTMASGEVGKGKKISITLISKDQKEKGEKNASEETGNAEAEKK